jgi:Flp pilus assembly protein TadG
LSLLLLIVFYMVDASLWVQNSIRIQAAVSAAASYGAIPGNATNHSAVAQIANFDATGNVNGATGFSAAASDFYTCSPGGATVTATTSCPTGAPYHYVNVTATGTAGRLIGLPGIPTSQTMNFTAIYRVEVAAQ